MPTLRHDFSASGPALFFARMHPKRTAVSKLLCHFPLRRCRIPVSVQNLCRTVVIAIPDPAFFHPDLMSFCPHTALCASLPLPGLGVTAEYVSLASLPHKMTGAARQRQGQKKLSVCLTCMP